MGGAIYLAVGAIPVLLGSARARSSGSMLRTRSSSSRSSPSSIWSVRSTSCSSARSCRRSCRPCTPRCMRPPRSSRTTSLVRAAPGLSERGKLWSVRLTVLALSVVAFLIAITSEGIHELVETASAFGSAGVFVATLFALFTRFGGPASAYASIISGMVVWAIGKYALELSVPYLLGLLAAFLGYVAFARVDAQASSERSSGRSKVNFAAPAAICLGAATMHAPRHQFCHKFWPFSATCTCAF